MFRILEDVVSTFGTKCSHAYCPTIVGFSKLGRCLSYNVTHCMWRCHLGPLCATLWELELEEPQQENVSILFQLLLLLKAITAFLSDPKVLCLLPASMQQLIG